MVLMNTAPRGERERERGPYDDCSTWFCRDRTGGYSRCTWRAIRSSRRVAFLFQASATMPARWLLLLVTIPTGAKGSGLLGIDIGNVNSVIASPRRGGVDVLVNEASRRQTPSVVAFNERRRFVGEGAVSFLVNKPAGCAAELKARLDASFNNADAELLEVTSQGTVQHFSATQLLAMLLHQLCVTASRELGSVPSDCTIAVPLHFDAARRQAILDAARIAGLRSTRLISEVRCSSQADAICPSCHACRLALLSTTAMCRSCAGCRDRARLCLRPKRPA